MTEYIKFIDKNVTDKQKLKAHSCKKELALLELMHNGIEFNFNFYVLITSLPINLYYRS